MRRAAVLLVVLVMVLGGCVVHRQGPVAAIGQPDAVAASAEPSSIPSPDPTAKEGGSGSPGDAGEQVSYSDRQNVIVVGTRRPDAPAPTSDDSLHFPSDTSGGNATETDVVSKTNVYQSGEFDPAKPMVALTFDDGPGKGTSRILDTLTQYGGRATFFAVGSVAEKKSDLLKRIAEQGSELGNHTWSHKDLTKLSYDSIYEELNRTNLLIEGAAGVWPTVMRPVGGTYDGNVTEAARSLGLSVINWSVDTKDWKHRDADHVYNAVMQDVKDGSIVICHDIYASTADAMERVIPELIGQGYQLVTISELLSTRQNGMEPGVVYTRK